MIKRVLGTLCLVITTAYGITKTEEEVFGKWLTWQKIFDDCSLSAHGYKRGRAPLHAMSSYCQRQAAFLKPMQPLLNTIFAHDADGEFLRTTKHYDQICKEVDTDCMRLLQRIEQSHFCSPARNEQEANDNLQKVIKQYNTFFRLLFLHKDNDATNQAMFAVANRLFESCYGNGFDAYDLYLNNKNHHQLVRLAQAVIWQQLVGHGWRNWHQSCLDGIVKAAHDKKEIVYVAGGNDMRQILIALLSKKTPLFTIRSIDPMLDTQEAFYADGYNWLLDGGGQHHGKGDVVNFHVGKRPFKLLRTHYREHGTFNATLANGITQELPLSLTTWHVIDAQGNRRGKIIFERRFCRQSDFMKIDNKALLLSFNEMYHVAIDQASGGWGIDVATLPDDLTMLVKQLRRPVTKEILSNIRKAEKAPCFFMFLGSCSN